MSHLSDIGFAFKDPTEFLTFVAGIVHEGVLFGSPNGAYARWSPGAGVELWIQADKAHVLIGCSLHFSGAGEMRVSVTQTFRTPGQSMVGSFYGWANPQDESNPYSGEYAFVASMPNFDAVEEKLLAHPMVTMQIAAFAQEIRFYGSDNVYYAMNPDTEQPPFDFRPSWRQGAEPGEPTAEAFCSGYVQQTELRQNPVTDKPFYWICLKVPGGTIDVVADPDIVRGRPTVGGVVQGTFWLSGRVISKFPEPKPRPTFRRAR